MMYATRAWREKCAKKSKDYEWWNRGWSAGGAKAER